MLEFFNTGNPAIKKKKILI